MEKFSMKKLAVTIIAVMALAIAFVPIVRTEACTYSFNGSVHSVGWGWSGGTHTTSAVFRHDRAVTETWVHGGGLDSVRNFTFGAPATSSVSGREDANHSHSYWSW